MRPFLADSVEKVRSLKSRGTISRASRTMSKDDSRYLLSLNHCFAPAPIVAAERTFSTESALCRHRGMSAPTAVFKGTDHRKL
jgi:hypothetical protein